MDKNFLTQKGKDVLLNIRVKANSDKFKILGINKWDKRLHIKLKSPARKGKANKELIERLRKIFNKEVGIFSGMKSRKKKILIKNASIEEILKKVS